MRSIWKTLMLSGALALAGCSSSEGTDAGAVLDTGAAAVDTGVSAADTGASVADTGASVADTGTGSGSSDAGAGDTGSQIQPDAEARDAEVAPDALDPTDATPTFPDATAGFPDATAPDASAPDASAPDASAPDAGPSAPTFATVYTTVLASCSCHTAGAGGLRFGNEQATYNALIGVTSNCNGLPYVAAGNPSGSFLHDKVANASPACGSRMPRGGRALPAATVQILTDWIAAGAPR